MEVTREAGWPARASTTSYQRDTTLAGPGTAFAGILVGRMRRDATVEGSQLVDRLGPQGTRRFLAAISE